MSPVDFITKWHSSTLKERSAAQEHFIDLCRLLAEPTPAEADPSGAWYCFEKGAKKAGGGDGWADVWKRGCFGWEYKGKGKDLQVAFKQLQLYTPALEYPPLLIVSDIDSIVIHTAFTGTVPAIHVIPLERLNDPQQRQLLKWAFTEPERLKPWQTTRQLTEAAAAQFAELAQQLRGRGHPPQQVAQFLNKLLFCLFADDTELLPRALFSRLLDSGTQTPERLNSRLGGLFQAMATGGDFGVDAIAWFDGGLFATPETLPLLRDEITTLAKLATFDWSAIEPSIFGTLFERGLDPDKRSQLGAHFTDPQSIMRLVNPVIVEPLQVEWAPIQTEIAALLTKAAHTKGKAASDKLRTAAERLYQGFLLRLSQFRILDPACGSGNFLYLGLKALKDLEQQVILDAEALGLPRSFPQVGPEAVTGIEINPYAAELARVTVWIGEIQWMLHHGYDLNRSPILRPLDAIAQRDAVLCFATPPPSPLPRTGEGVKVQEPEWPEADVIVGNPPFLGGNKKRRELGNTYFEALAQIYKHRVPDGADLVCYWFEKAGMQITQGKAQRAGLVATQSIRSGSNRQVLEHINTTGQIFNAWSDEPWVNDGAAVRVSLVCFGNTATQSMLNGQQVSAIYADLTAQSTNSATDSNLTQAKRLKENDGVAFTGTTKCGHFDIPGDMARQWLKLSNPHSKPNSNVLRPWANGMDITRRPSDTWIIDFGAGMSEADAAMYEIPFQHVLTNVKATRHDNRVRNRERYWWLHGATAAKMRMAVGKLSRFIATSRVAKHRIFTWLSATVLPDSRLYAIARADDATLGLLHSRIHEIWSLATCSWHGVGNDPTYNAISCFETFPFPEGVLHHPNPDAHFPDIAQAAQRLTALRDTWLNPPEWVDRVPEIVSGYPERIIPKPGHEAELKQRTLTNLYNQRPAWLAHAHKTLDTAVAAAYGWPEDLSDKEILTRLLELNFDRSHAPGHWFSSI